jgi:hypothetical protein
MTIPQLITEEDIGEDIYFCDIARTDLIQNLTG